LTLSGEVLDVDVGIVTGLNEFFVMSEETARDKNLFEFTQPIVTRSAHLQGMVFSEEDLSNNGKNGYLTRLLLVPNQTFDRLPQCLKDYIGFGEQNNYHQGYKCRIRKNWYVVPSVWRPDGFMLRQIHLYPKIIANCTAATSTDTIHRVRFKGALPGSQIATAFFNSLSFLFSEVVGRSYGGGVLELEPSEAELIPLPLQGSQAIDPEEIDLLIRAGNAETALKITNKVLLSKNLGLNSNEIKCLDSAWRKLRDRRVNRNHARKAEVV
jgi:adenine-specific DNA-methyltransferase